MTDTSLDTSYDRAAQRWQAKLEYLGFDRAYRALVRAVPVAVPAQTRVLEAGCGTGCLSAEFLRVHGPVQRITLLDPAPEMLSHAHRSLTQFGLDPVTVKGRLGADTQGPHDVVLCAHVLEHLPDLDVGLRQLRQELKPGGTLVLAVSKPHWCSRLVWLRWQHATFRPPFVRHALAGAGFGDVQTHPLGKGPPGRVSMGYLVQG